MTRSRWIGIVVVVALGAGAAAWWSSRPSSRVPSTGRDGPPGGRANAVARVTEHGLTIVDELEPLPLEEWMRRGRPSSAGDTILISTGISDGPVHVAVEALAGPPPAVEVDGWEEVAEISIHPKGRLRVSSTFDGSAGDLPVLNPTGTGPHRLRVHVTGRAVNYDGVDEEPRERYLLLVWPGPPGAEQVLRPGLELNGVRSASDLVRVLPALPMPPDLPQRLTTVAPGP